MLVYNADVASGQFQSAVGHCLLGGIHLSVVCLQKKNSYGQILIKFSRTVNNCTQGPDDLILVMIKITI